MTTTSNSSPLETTFPGNLGHFDLVLDIPSVLPRISPLLLFFGEVSNEYKGNMSPGSEQIVLKSTAVSSPDFRWLEFDSAITDTTQVNGAHNNSTTDITVDDSSVVTVGDLVRNLQTGEVLYVSAIPDATSLTVTRGWGATVATNTSYPSGLNSVTAAAMSDNDDLLVLGPAMEQFSNNRTTTLNDETQREGATQIIRRDIAISGSRLEQERNTRDKDSTFNKRKAQATVQMFEDLEKVAIFGKLKRTATSGTVGTVQNNSNNLTTTDGYLHVISAYASANVQNANTLSVSDASGGQNLTIDKLDDIAGIIADRGDPSRYINFCSKDYKKAFQKILTGASNAFTLNVEMGAKETDVGSKARGYIGQYGEMSFVEHPLYNKNDTMKATLNCLNRDMVKLVHLNNRAVHWVDESQDPSEDGKAAYAIGEHGVCIAHAKSHFQFDNFTALGV